MGKVPANLSASIGGAARQPSYLERLAAKQREEHAPLTAVAVIMVDNKGNIALGSLIDHREYDDLNDSPVVGKPSLIEDLGKPPHDFERTVQNFLDA